MKAYKFILLIFISALFCNGSCEHSTEGQRFIIRNNSNLEIIPVFDMYYSIAQHPSCIKPATKFEIAQYNDSKIKPYSSKNFESNKIAEYIISKPNDTIYIGIFNCTDIDAMSCEEFKQEYPLKKEWKVTLSDMQAADWTLVYTPE